MKKFKHTCMKCGYKWEGKLEKPKSCVACKSFRWDEATNRKSGRKKEKEGGA